MHENAFEWRWTRREEKAVSIDRNERILLNEAAAEMKLKSDNAIEVMEKSQKVSSFSPLFLFKMHSNFNNLNTKLKNETELKNEANLNCLRCSSTIDLNK